METPAIVEALELTSWWEVPAVVLAILYLVLAARESIWCWGAAFASTAIYTYVFFDVNLYLESVLQIYYLGMAVYGWYQWRHPADRSSTLPISTWSLKKHGVVIAATAVVVVLSGHLLDKNTEAALPYLDAFTTWYAVVTTYMVAKKILENWGYWFVIDSALVYLSYSRGLYLTSLLYVAYLIIIVFGYWKWKKEYSEQMPKPALKEEPNRRTQ